MVHVERTFARRNWSRIAFCRMRWNSSGSSAAGRSAVLLREPQHRVLHDVERRLLVVHREHACLKARRSTQAGSRTAPSGWPGWLLCCWRANGSKSRRPRTLPRFGLTAPHASLYCSKAFPPLRPWTQWIERRPAALTGAEIVIRCLQEEGVEYVFGYPGGAVLYIYDELFKQDKVKHVLVRHEQGAVHAADGYSRSSKKVGVALVTSGPGVTNAVTGIATAYMDSIPMVVITGQVPTHAIGQDAFQECDTVGITRPCVKHNFLVKDVKDLASTIKKAFYIATTGRPGPVVVDIPKDVTAADREFHYPKRSSLRSYNPVRKGHAGQIKKAVQLLLEAKRPMVYAGGGVVSRQRLRAADASSCACSASRAPTR